MKTIAWIILVFGFVGLQAQEPKVAAGSFIQRIEDEAARVRDQGYSQGHSASGRKLPNFTFQTPPPKQPELAPRNWLEKSKKGTNSGTGGDPEGLHFRRLLLEALKEIEAAEPAFYHEKIRPMELEALSQTVTLVFSDVRLPVQAGDVIQNSLARVNKYTRRIEVDRKQWDQIQSDRVKKAIALHEYLSIVGVETTGYYPLSGFYYADLVPEAKFDFIEVKKILATAKPASKERISTTTLSCLQSELRRIDGLLNSEFQFLKQKFDEAVSREEVERAQEALANFEGLPAKVLKDCRKLSSSKPSFADYKACLNGVPIRFQNSLKACTDNKKTKD